MCMHQEHSACQIGRSGTLQGIQAFIRRCMVWESMTSLQAMSMLPYQHGAVKVCIIDVIAACKAVQLTPPGITCSDMTCSKIPLSFVGFNVSCSYRVGVNSKKQCFLRHTGMVFLIRQSLPPKTKSMTMPKALSYGGLLKSQHWKDGIHFVKLCARMSNVGRALTMLPSLCVIFAQLFKAALGCCAVQADAGSAELHRVAPLQCNILR